MGQLAEGPAHRALPAPLRTADISQKPVPRPAADEARRIQGKGDRRSDQAATGSGSLGQAEPLRSLLCGCIRAHRRVGELSKEEYRWRRIQTSACAAAVSCNRLGLKSSESEAAREGGSSSSASGLSSARGSCRWRSSHVPSAGKPSCEFLPEADSRECRTPKRGGLAGRSRARLCW